MKKIFSLLVLAVLVLSASAQDVSGPIPKIALTCGTGFIVPGVTTTNIPPSLAPVFYPGRDGVFIGLQVLGTNATTTTNATAIVEVVKGTNVIDNQTYNVVFAQNGLTVYDFGTNIPSSAANILNAPGLRIRSIQNTNTASIIISNITAFIRP